MISILVPVYNEQLAIETTVRTLHTTLSTLTNPWEILIINDGSTDQTATILSSIDLSHVRIITHPQNLGNGAAIKTGIRHSHGDIIGTVDADGTYPLADFPRLLKELHRTNCDMIVGSRPWRTELTPWHHRIAKIFLTALAEYLTKIVIPDINSGMRLFRRPLAERYMRLYPRGFSLHITITLAALTNTAIVVFSPIGYGKRLGRSKLSWGLNGPENFLRFCHIILRIVCYFRPLRFFLWPALFTAMLGITGLMTDVHGSGFVLIAGLQIALCGVIAEILVRTRRPDAFADRRAAVAS